jgi:hypothetical protein
MHWQRRLAALFVLFTLAGCAQGITGQAGAPNTLHPPENTGNGPGTAAGMEAVAVAAVCSGQGVGTVTHV